MAHLTCVKHGKRSVVLMGERVGAIQVDVKVRHRTNHDSSCDSINLLFGGKIIDKYEVFDSQYDSGVAVAIADAANLAALRKMQEDEQDLKEKLRNKFLSPPLKRIRGRV